MRRFLLSLMILSFALPFCSGCGNHTLETGYVYTPLGVSTDKRRGYYADPFSPEARAAQSEDHATGVDLPRPIPGK